MSAIRCASDGFDFSDVNALIKNPLFYKTPEGYESVQLFENYVLKKTRFQTNFAKNSKTKRRKASENAYST
ncbi:MAG: hypothetical protein L6V85_09850 [Clostridiales bacterium]|nr:MAG: hypothetical protein L6V85_09850 [Clostridiales bacterium]